MDVVTIVIGLLICIYGFFTMFMRVKFPEKFGKLRAMKERFGDGVGNTIHLVAYSLVPIILGLVLIFSGFIGLSLLQVLKS